MKTTFHTAILVKGYELNHKGTNGFSCFVERTEQELADFRNDVYAAICFDAEGSEKILPVWMDTAKMRAEGRLSPLEVKQEIARRYEDGTYRPPSRPGISYMIAPLRRTYPNTDLRNHDVVTMNMPHYMYYATHVTDNDIGGGQFNSLNPFILQRSERRRPNANYRLLTGQYSKDVACSPAF